jgi:hypothetical protein
MTRRCKGADGLGNKSDGTPCEGINVDPESSYCPAHGPGSAARMRERGRRGAEATAAKNRGKGVVDSAQAPDPPETMEDAARIASWACHGVYTGLLDPRVGQQTAALLREFRTARKESDLDQRVRALEASATAREAGK